MKKYYPFYIAIALLFGTLLVFNKQFFKGSKKYLGVTQSKEYKISSQKSATVQKVLVEPGQAVEKGQLLVELTSSDLQIEIDKQKNQILSSKSEMAEKAKLIYSEIEYLRAQKGIKVEEIDSKVLGIKKEIQLNRQLMKELGETIRESSDDDPLQLEIRSLNEKKRLHLKAIDIKISDIRQENETEQTLLKNKIDLLTKELEVLENENKKLNKYATFKGVVENVYVKDGEEVQSYTNVLSINPKYPTSAVGYIMGKRPGSQDLGTEVLVASYESQTTTTKGEIIGLGSMTELPNILQKSTAVTAYGLEVFIKLEDGSQFTSGQKIIIY